MARRTPRPEAKLTTTLIPLRQTCEACGNRLWVAYHRRRKVMTLEGLYGEFGLDMIVRIGSWRFVEHRSVPEMHHHLQARGLAISEREVTHLMQRYEELVTDAASLTKSGSRCGCRNKNV